MSSLPNQDPTSSVQSENPLPGEIKQCPPSPPEHLQLPPAYNQPLPIVYNQPLPTISQPESQGQSQIGWMNAPQPPPNCPPGLEYLSMIDQVLVHQQIELLEVLTGWETNNKYEIKNSLGQKVYFAVEDNDCLTLQCCGPARPFDMKVLDNFGNEVIHLYRPLACSSCCCFCCLQSIEVTAPPGTVVGSVQQEWSIFYPTFAVKDASGDTVMRIEGPFFTIGCCKDVKFRITSADGSQELGKITKQWGGFAREYLTDADNFGITFPMDLDVKMKAVMLGACFLIDMMFFEQAGNNNNN